MPVRLGQEVQALSRAARSRSLNRSLELPETRALKSLDIVAGALLDPEGRVLIAQRPEGRELAGRWEFPGGKLHADESPYDGLARELREELGIEVRAAERLLRYPWQYPDKVVWLDLWFVRSWSGEVRGLDGQALKWVRIGRLCEEDILEADRPMIEALGGLAGAASR